MQREFRQFEWNGQLESDWRVLLALALAEDLGHDGDWTSRALIAPGIRGSAELVARRAGVIAGLPAVPATLAAVDPGLRFSPAVDDGQRVEASQLVGRIDGPAVAILSAERIMLNLLGRLSGIATRTRQFVDAVAGTAARIYDTRKTTPGWRRLEKYAVRCGGGWNHREGLFAAVLIKDNHLAVGRVGRGPDETFSAANAVRRARAFLRQQRGDAAEPMIVEVELDSLDRLEEVLAAEPDIVLLDNMTPAQLREAVARRDALGSRVEFEASGGVDLENVRDVAGCGVERISIGALTHSAPALDLALDWADPAD